MHGCYDNADFDRKIHLKIGFHDYSTNYASNDIVENIDWFFLITHI